MTRHSAAARRPAMAPRRFTSRCEVRLAFAILLDALSCLAERGDDWRIPRRLYRWEAEQWIESRDPGPLFSFENVCLILLLDPEYIRARLRRWRARRPGRPIGQRILADPARVLAGAARPEWAGSRADRGCSIGG